MVTDKLIMKINKEEIDIIELEIDSLNEYIKFTYSIKEEMAHSEWVGDFTKQDYEHLLLNNSKIYLWIYQGEIIASGMLIPAGLRDLEKFNLKDMRDRKVIDFGPEMVKSKYRGNGIQKDILKYLENKSREEKYEYGIVTVHPDNIYSLNNIKEVGFKQIGVVELSRGKRLVLVKKF